jgi:hypothetical protein
VAAIALESGQWKVERKLRARILGLIRFCAQRLRREAGTTMDALHRRKCRWATVLCVIGSVVGSLAFEASARAVPSTWSGQSQLSPEWADAGNWEGGLVPPLEASALIFPKLGGECASAKPKATCYISQNKAIGRRAKALRLDDADGYVILGEEMTLGEGGLTAYAPESSFEIGDLLALPLQLNAAQTWRLEGNGRPLKSWVEVAGPVAGVSHPLAVELGNQASLFLAGSTEVGALAVRGVDASASAGASNGALHLEEDLNSSDLNPVSLSHVLVTGSATVGPLSTSSAELEVGHGSRPTGAISVASATLDPASRVALKIAGAPMKAGQDYSQLSSQGAVSLNGATLALSSIPPERSQECPTLDVGATYTLVSTTGPLSGTFGNAPEGSQVPVSTAGCGHHPEQQLQIAYHLGAVSTVTGAVLEDAEEANARKEHEEDSKRRERETGHAGERAIAEANAKRHAEEEAVANRKREEEQRAQSAVQSFQTIHHVPDAELAGTRLEVGPGGLVTLSISCPNGESACRGTVTLRTLNAVAARKAVLKLGSANFAVTGGSVGKVKLRLSRKARRLLARVRSLRAGATLVAADPLGETHTAHTIVTLRAAKHRRHPARATRL